MRISYEKIENYQKNLFCIQDVTDKLLGHMKGYDYSFRSEITDRKGNYNEEKLRGLVEEMLSGWAEEVRYGMDTDPATGENMAEPYIRARHELYSLYLYLVMRCSLSRGAYRACSGSEEERSDFAFLLEQAKRFSRSWCVMSCPDKAKRNVPFEGFDPYFGFHLYHVLSNPGLDSFDHALTPHWKSPVERLDLLTNEGSMKRILYKHFVPASRVMETEEAERQEELVQSEEDAGDSGYDYDDYDYDDYDDYDPEEDRISREIDEAAGLWDYAMEERRQEQLAQSSLLESLVWSFTGREEYILACKRFVSLYEQAEPEVLRGFYEDLERIVDLYLVQKEISPLTNTDNALDVYSRIYDGPYRQAKRYGRGIQWNNI